MANEQKKSPFAVLKGKLSKISKKQWLYCGAVVVCAGLAVAAVVAPPKIANAHLMGWMLEQSELTDYAYTAEISASGTESDFRFHTDGNYMSESGDGSINLSYQYGDMETPVTITGNISENILYTDTFPLFDLFGNKLVETLGLNQPAGENFYSDLIERDFVSDVTAIDLKEYGVEQDSQTLSHFLGSVQQYFYSTYYDLFWELMANRTPKGVGSELRSEWTTDDLLKVLASYDEYLEMNREGIHDGYISIWDAGAAAGEMSPNELIQKLGEKSAVKMTLAETDEDKQVDDLLKQSDAWKDWVSKNEATAAFSFTHKDGGYALRLVLVGKDDQTVQFSFSKIPVDSVEVTIPDESESLASQIGVLKTNLSASVPVDNNNMKEAEPSGN